jgi:hypothetical protein
MPCLSYKDGFLLVRLLPRQLRGESMAAYVYGLPAQSSRVRELEEIWGPG